jgi:hypothetical protein
MALGYSENRPAQIVTTIAMDISLVTGEFPESTPESNWKCNSQREFFVNEPDLIQLCTMNVLNIRRGQLAGKFDVLGVVKIYQRASKATFGPKTCHDHSHDAK